MSTDVDTRVDLALVIAAHQPSRWRSFTNDNEILRCCGQDFGNPTRKAKRGDSDTAWAAYSEHLAQAVAVAITATQVQEPQLTRVMTTCVDPETRAELVNEGYELAIAQMLCPNEREPDEPVNSNDWDPEEWLEVQRADAWDEGYVGHSVNGVNPYRATS